MVNPLHLVTKGLLTGNSLSIATSGGIYTAVIITIVPNTNRTGTFGMSGDMLKSPRLQRIRQDDEEVLMIVVSVITSGIIK